MRYLSTVGRAPATTLKEALFAGLAPDGGLYLPERLDRMPASQLAGLPEQSLHTSALMVARHLFEPDVTASALEAIVTAALDFEIPLIQLDEELSVLELFHGPTLAFKDVGARFMARLMQHFRRQEDRELIILAATSGDTGSAVAHAFHRLEGFRVVVLFPDGKVSPAQQKLFTTLGGNVEAVAVAGTFDDCQRLAKAAFADSALRRRRALASANSINIGRLLPQLFYYFHLVAQLPPSPVPLVAVPSGNFGNLTAGVLARQLGLECRLLAATNANDVVPRFLASGHYDPRSSTSTLSCAMDVGEPSNLQRILHLYGHSSTRLARDVLALAVSDEETVDTIGRVREDFGYTLDPHTAVGYSALRRALHRAGDDRRGAVLATAHPAKFAEIVEAATGEEMVLPEALARCLGLAERTLALEPHYPALRDLLDGLS